MKTQISKENIIGMLTEAIRFNKLRTEIYSALGQNVIDENCLKFGYFASGLFGIEVNALNVDEEEEYFKAWQDIVYSERSDHKIMAEEIYKNLSQFALTQNGNQETTTDMEHSEAIIEIIADAIIFDRVVDEIYQLAPNYKTGEGKVDFYENVRGYTKAFPLMGLMNEDESNNSMIIELQEIYKSISEVDTDIATRTPTSHIDLAKSILKEWEIRLSRRKLLTA